MVLLWLRLERWKGHQGKGRQERTRWKMHEKDDQRVKKKQVEKKKLPECTVEISTVSTEQVV